MPRALGLVETRGLVAAIEAADAMVKASNVTLIGKEVTNPALITIKIVGDVAAVKASVDAGAAAAARVGVLVSTHVIPQPDSQMAVLFPEIEDKVEKSRATKKEPPARGRITDEERPSEARAVLSTDNSTKESVQKSVKAVRGDKKVSTNTGAQGALPVVTTESEPGAELPEELIKEDSTNPENEISDHSAETTPAISEVTPEGAKKPEKTAESSGKAGAPVSRPIKSKAPKQQRDSEGENLFSINTDHLEKLRREALGIKEPKFEKQEKISGGQSGKSTGESTGKAAVTKVEHTMDELEKMNVHNLRKAARATEAFPIQGREISRANRRELLDLFKKIV